MTMYPNNLKSGYLGIRILGCLLLIFLLGSCSRKAHDARGVTTLSGNAMTIDYRITFGEILSPQKIQQARSIINLTFDEVNSLYNQWNPASDISALNQLKAGERVAPPAPLYQLLLFVNEIVALSKGRYDPTVEPLRKLWIGHLDNGSIPDTQEIANIAPAIGWNQVHLQDGLFWKDSDGIQLTLDSVSKGLCVDIILERLQAAGFHHLLVEWGGELRATGQHPEGRPWKVFIRRLGSMIPEDSIADLSLVDSAVATSGDYLQYWTVDGVSYFHVFDAKRLQPLTIHSNSVASSTVVAPTCALADALATTLMCFESMEAARDWAEQLQERFPQTDFWLAARTQDPALSNL